MFRRPSTRYGQRPEPVTPYQRAAQVWDDRIGSARVQAKNWRLAFFGCLALSGGLAGGLVWQSLSDVFGGGAAYSDLSMTRHGDVGFVFERGPNDRDPYAWLTFGKVAGIPSGGSSSNKRRLMLLMVGGGDAERRNKCLITSVVAEGSRLSLCVCGGAVAGSARRYERAGLCGRGAHTRRVRGGAFEQRTNAELYFM